MSKQALLIIERKNEVLRRLPLSSSTFYTKILQGMWCPPISLGERAKGYLKHETDAVLAAMCAGNSPDEIKELVACLVAERESLKVAING